MKKLKELLQKFLKKEQKKPVEIHIEFPTDKWILEDEAYRKANGLN